MNGSVIQWKTKSIKHKIATLLIIDGVSFTFTPGDGIVFSGTEEYVKRLIYRLNTCYGVSIKPNIEPIK